MNFSCDACGRAYSVPDEKVQGRAFRVTCRQCGAMIRVPASQPSAPAAARPGQPAGRPVPRPPPPLPPRPVPHVTPPTTHAVGAGPVPRANVPGMTDEEMAWLGGGEVPRSRPAPEATAPGAGVFGSTTDAEAGARAVEALTGPVEPREDPGSGSPGSPMAPPPAAEPRGPGAARIAVAALLVLAAAAVAAWQLGWLFPRPAARPAPRAAPPPVPAAAAPAPVTATPPASPSPAQPAPAPGPAPVAGPAGAAPAPEGAAAAPSAPPASPVADPSPAPVPAPGTAPAKPKRTAAPADDRAQRNLRIARNDWRLLDLLEKKGDAAPAAPVERSTLDTGLAELDQPAVERALRENRPAFAACVSRALKADPSLRVDDRKATLFLTVRPNGTVQRAWVGEADLEGTPLGRCLSSAARRVVFPAFQGSALDVSAPLVLGAIR
ncbi:MAG: AgmX/PglI C-terminal domain-containing protein [Anaeromyxobacteraceae bacterium]